MASGWRVRVTTMDRSGRPALYQDFLVFESEESRAVELVRFSCAATEHQVIEALTSIGPDEINSFRMRRGEIRPVSLRDPLRRDA